MNKSIVSFILSGTLILGSFQDMSAFNTSADSIVSMGESNHIVKKINGNKLLKDHISILRNACIISSVLGGTLGIGTIATMLALKACASNVTSTEQTNSFLKSINTKQLNDSDDLLVSSISRLDSVGCILESENSLLRIKVNHGQKVYMVGDIHSDLKALDFILNFIDNHPDDKFIFLGDYVDRGNHGEEVFLKLAELKINNPDRVFLLRGNHEVKTVNSCYGFLKELKTKYNDYNEIYDKFNNVFDKLPVAAVLDCRTKKIFCVHGGICPSKDNGTLNVSDLENLPKIKPVEKSIMESLLWSDPNRDENQSQFIESDRGAGYVYSKKNVTDFLRKNGLDCIVRAHETVQSGIEELFDGKVKTVFSVPHYGSLFNPKWDKCNSGAILGFDNTTNQFEAIKFDRSSNPQGPYVEVN